MNIKNVKTIVISLTAIILCCSCKVNVNNPVHVDEYYQATEIPIIVRDFVGYDREVDPSLTAYKHPDFDHWYNTGLKPNLINGFLDKDKKPIFNDNISPEELNIESKESFAQWFRTIEGVNKEVRKTITFESIVNSSDYEFLDYNFFPIDGEGFGDFSYTHNCNFTVEATFYLLFEEKTFITFDCESSDDLWIFVNNVLAVDLGNLHTNARKCTVIRPEDLNRRYNANAKPGDYIEIKIFKASRNSSVSQLRIKVSPEIYLKK